MRIKDILSKIKSIHMISVQIYARYRVFGELQETMIRKWGGVKRMRVKDILPYIDDIVDIYINDELQVNFWCSNGRTECNLYWYLDCKVINIKTKDGYLSLEVE
jgi:hypothetical protein